VVFPADGVVYLLRLETGELLWSQEVSDEITSPAIINGMIVVGSDDGTVTAFGAK
jgi:outer membrane protein assembly factor BamB